MSLLPFKRHCDEHQITLANEIVLQIVYINCSYMKCEILLSTEYSHLYHLDVTSLNLSNSRDENMHRVMGLFRTETCFPVK